MRIGVLEVATDAVHLLVAQSTWDGTLERIANRTKLVAFSDGSPLTGHLDARTWARGVEAVGTLTAHARQWDCEITAVTTAHVRDLRGGRVFLDTVRREAGVEVRILSAFDEAASIYRGALASLPYFDGRICVISVDGGGAQIVVGDGENVLHASNLPLGIRALRKTLLDRGGLLGTSDARVTRDLVRAAASDAVSAVHALRPDLVILTSDMARSLSGLADTLGHSGDVPGRLPRAAVCRIVSALTKLTGREIRHLGVSRRRADTISIGAVVVATLMEMIGAESARISASSLKEGVALQAMGAARDHARTFTTNV